MSRVMTSVIDGGTDGIDFFGFLDFLFLGPNGMVFETCNGADLDGWWWAVVTARGCVDGDGADNDIDGFSLPLGGLFMGPEGESN